MIARRRSVVAALACTALATAALGWILASRGDELTAALDRLPVGIFALATLLHLVVLVVRAEAWGITLQATSGRAAGRRVLHASCAGGYLAGAVQLHVALPVRMAIMRRLAPRDAPSVRGMVLSDMPLFWFEVLLGCAIAPVAALAVPGLSWWIAPLALVASIATVVGLRLGHARFAHHRLAGGLAILGARRLRWVLAALGAAIAVLTFVRIAVLAQACGLPVDAPRLALLYLAIGALGLLPIGPASVPGATLVAAGGTAGVGPAGATGLAIAASTIAGVLIYALGMAIATGGVALVSRNSNGRRAPRPDRPAAQPRGVQHGEVGRHP